MHSRCCILISFLIYLLAGREIYAKRNQLRAFGNPTRPVPVQIENPFTGFKTTEIHITSELATLHSPRGPNVFMMPDKKRAEVADKGYDQYSVTIGSTPMSPRSEVPPPTIPSVHSTIAQQNNRAAMEANRAAFGYTKVALLYFVSLLVTWVNKLPHVSLDTSLELSTRVTRPIGSLINKSCLLPDPPLTRLPSLHLRLRDRAPLDGLLELRHLHHNLLGRRAIAIQR